MLADCLQENLSVVFCGTAAGKRSGMVGHYYAGRGNRFWSLLAEIGLTPTVLQPEQDRELTRYGLGLTDLAKCVSGMDHEIPAEAYLPDSLAAIIARYSPKSVAFNGLTAARIVLGQKVGPGRVDLHSFDGTVIWVLPSTSGAARGAFSATPWREMAEWVRKLTVS